MMLMGLPWPGYGVQDLAARHWAVPAAFVQEALGEKAVQEIS